MSDAPSGSGTRSVGRLVGALLAAAALFVIGAGIAVAPSLLAGNGGSATGTIPPFRPTRTPTPTPTPSPTPTLASAPPVQPLASALKARVLFAYQSVGEAIAKSVPNAYAHAKLRKPKVAKWDDVMRKPGAVLATAMIGRNGDPTSKLKAFAALVNDAPRNSIDVAVMAFNPQDITAQTDVDALFLSYVATMQSLEAANPDVGFLYTTAPVTGENSWREVEGERVDGLTEVSQPVWQDNIARERFNTMVRKQYLRTGRLFDIAALQAQLGGGKVAAKQHESHWYYVLNPALSPDGRKLNAKGATALANQLMMLVTAVSST